MSDLARRLASPSRSLPLVDLAGAWGSAKILVRVEGLAVLAHDLVLLRRIRGGVGSVLLESASEEAASGRACPWTPACALDVFYREQGRHGAHGIPKPFVLTADRRGPDLVVALTLFGYAMDWSAVMQHALVSTLRHRIDWRAQRTDVFIPKFSIGDVSVRQRDQARPTAARTQAEVEFLTPMNAERDDPVARPGTIFARLARRIEGLALWHDVAVAADWASLARQWNEVAYDVRSLRAGNAHRHSGGSQAHFDVPTVSGTLFVADLTPDLWTLLALGAETHVGKGAVEGFGRYLLHGQ
jgi:hypothetical protein